MYQHLIMNGGSATSSPLHLTAANEETVAMTTLPRDHRGQSHLHHSSYHSPPTRQHHQRGSTASNGDIHRLCESTTSLEERFAAAAVAASSNSSSTSSTGCGGRSAWLQWIPRRCRHLRPHLTTLWNVWWVGRSLSFDQFCWGVPWAITRRCGCCVL